MNRLLSFALLSLFALRVSAADTSIAGLPAASSVSGTDVAPVTQSGTTRKATVSQIEAYVASQLTKSTVGLGNVDNTSDATKNSAVATLTNKTLTAPVINSPTGLAKGDVGLGNVDNTSDASKASTERTAVATLTNKTLTSPVINSPTGIVKADVGLGSVDNTSDAAKNSASATLTNKTLTAPAISSPTGLVKADVGLGNVDNTSDATKNSAVATLTNKTLTTPAISSPTGLVKADVGLGSVENTALSTWPGGSTSMIWTGTTQKIQATEPRLILDQSGATTDERLWDVDLAAKVLCLRTRTNADGAGISAFCVTRGTGTALSAISFPSTVAPTFAGGLGVSGTTTAITSPRYSLSVGGTVTGTGIVSSATNVVDVVTNGAKAITVDASQNVFFRKAVADISYSAQTPTTGFSITIGNNTGSLLLNPAGTLASGTIIMPATPIDGQFVRISTSQTITSLTLSANTGQSILAAPVTLTAATPVTYQYQLSGTTWYKVASGN